MRFATLTSILLITSACSETAITVPENFAGNVVGFNGDVVAIESPFRYLSGTTPNDAMQQRAKQVCASRDFRGAEYIGHERLRSQSYNVSTSYGYPYGLAPQSNSHIQSNNPSKIIYRYLCVQ